MILHFPDFASRARARRMTQDDRSARVLMRLGVKPRLVVRDPQEPLANLDQ